MHGSLIISCEWSGCHHSDMDRDALSNHLQDHIEFAWQQEVRACRWGNCRTTGDRGALASLMNYTKHVQSHLVQHLCTHPGCPRKKSFRDATDLERHRRVKHSGISRFDCPFQTVMLRPSPELTSLCRISKTRSTSKTHFAFSLIVVRIRSSMARSSKVARQLVHITNNTI
jgi:hypothetical protein